MTDVELEKYVWEQERLEWERQEKRAEILEKINEHNKILAQAETELNQVQSHFSSVSKTALLLLQQYERNPVFSEGNIAKEYDRVHSVCGKSREKINNDVSQMIGTAEASIACLQSVIAELQAEYDSI